MRLEIRPRWQGADLDRVMNAAHADLHEAVATHFGTLEGWTWLPEVKFAHFGERGVIDMLAWHEETRSLLIIELKTELVDPQELVATMHRRIRLGPRIAQEHGWYPLAVSAWVIVADSRIQRRRRDRHAQLLQSAFPSNGHAVRSWLLKPTGRISALSFWAIVTPGRVSQNQGRVQRVRRPSSAG